MTVFGFLIGTLHHVRLCRHLGKLFHLLLVIYVLSVLVWYFWAPFLFWSPGAACCKYQTYIWDNSHHFYNVFAGVSAALLVVGLIAAICISRRKNQFRY